MVRVTIIIRLLSFVIKTNGFGFHNNPLLAEISLKRTNFGGQSYRWYLDPTVNQLEFLAGKSLPRPGEETWDLFFVFFLSLKQRLRPLSYCAHQFLVRSWRILSFKTSLVNTWRAWASQSSWPAWSRRRRRSSTSPSPAPPTQTGSSFSLQASSQNFSTLLSKN